MKPKLVSSCAQEAAHGGLRNEAAYGHTQMVALLAAECRQKAVLRRLRRAASACTPLRVLEGMWRRSTVHTMNILRSNWSAVPACRQRRSTLSRHSVVMASATQNAKERAETDKAIPQQSTRASEVKLPEAGGVSYQPRLDVIPLRHTKVCSKPRPPPPPHWNILCTTAGSTPAYC